MTRITATEFQQNVGLYSDAALREPVVITSHNRDRLVLTDVEDYNRLKKLEAILLEEDRMMDSVIETHADVIRGLADK